MLSTVACRPVVADRSLAEPTPGLEAWPPVVAREGTAPAVTLARRGTAVILENAGTASYWLAPPALQVWTGPPWTTADWPSGAVELAPGSTRTLDVTPAERRVRVSATIWPTAETDRARGGPWFLWLQVPVVSP